MSEEQRSSGRVVQETGPASAGMMGELREEGLPQGWFDYWQGERREIVEEPVTDDCDPAETSPSIEEALSEVAAGLELVAGELAKVARLLVELEKETARPGS